jgi:hypothetical protein
MSKILGVVAIYLALILAGCTPAPPSVAGDGYTAQIIVKFSDATMNPSENIFVDQLSHDAGARLIYVRPMSGAAHVFEVRGLHDAAELQEVLRRLAKRSGVVYAEEDRVRRAQ